MPDLYDIIREEYRALSSEAKTKIRRVVLSVIVEEVTDGLIAAKEARRDALAVAQQAGAEEPMPGSGLQVYGILARESTVAANLLMMEASTEPADVVPYRSIAAIVGEADYSKTQRGILELLASQGHAVLPLRPGLRCQNVRGVIDMLATQYEVLRQGLTELENQEEWVISIYCNRHGLLESVRASDKKVDRTVDFLLAVPMAHQWSDAAVFSFSQWTDAVMEIMQPSIDSVAKTLIENCVNYAHLRLAGLAQDSIRHHVGAETGLVSSGAYVVPRTSDGLFRALLQTLSATYHRLGFSFHSIGPRTPIIFARHRSFSGDATHHSSSIAFT